MHADVDGRRAASASARFMEAAVRNLRLSFLEDDKRFATGDCHTFQSGGFGSLRMLRGMLSGTSTGDRSFGGDVAGRK